jgi:hypothetical protein
MHCGSQTADGLGQTRRAQLPKRQEGHGALHPVIVAVRGAAISTTARGDLEMNQTDIYRKAIQRTFAELYSVRAETVDVLWDGESITVRCAGKTFTHQTGSDDNKFVCEEPASLDKTEARILAIPRGWRGATSEVCACSGPKRPRRRRLQPAFHRRRRDYLQARPRACCFEAA